MSGSRSAREALVTELLGDADRILERVEALHDRVEERQRGMETISGTLDAATDRFRLAVTAFADEGRQTLMEYVQRKTAAAAETAGNEQKALIEAAARSIWAEQVAGEVVKLSTAIRQASSVLDQARASRWFDIGTTAVVTSMLTATLLYFVGR